VVEEAQVEVAETDAEHRALGDAALPPEGLAEHADVVLAHKGAQAQQTLGLVHHLAGFVRVGRQHTALRARALPVCSRGLFTLNRFTSVNNRSTEFRNLPVNVAHAASLRPGDGLEAALDVTAVQQGQLAEGPDQVRVVQPGRQPVVEDVIEGVVVQA